MSPPSPVHQQPRAQNSPSADIDISAQVLEVMTKNQRKIRTSIFHTQGGAVCTHEAGLARSQGFESLELATSHHAVDSMSLIVVPEMMLSLLVSPGWLSPYTRLWLDCCNYP